MRCSPIWHLIFTPAQFVRHVSILAPIDQIVSSGTSPTNALFEPFLHVGCLPEALGIISFHRLPFLTFVLEARNADIQYLQHLVHTVRCLAQRPAIQNVAIQIFENPCIARQQMTCIFRAQR